jgi:hypothetical protein
VKLTTSNFFFFQLNTCFRSPYVTSSLTREWVCSLQLLLALASEVILSSDSLGTRDHILLPQIRDSRNLGGQVPVFISPQEHSGPVILPDTGFTFRRLLRLAGLRWKYSTLPPRGRVALRVRVRVTLRLAVYRQSVRLGDKPL